jgi:histidyl-tRNA synthetase
VGKKEQKKKIQSIRGTRDILPPESDRWLWLEKTCRRVLRRFGYSEIRSPIFEHTELFQKGTGESTDIVLKQMYTFEDRGGRSLTLRPEGTPSVARALIERGLLKRSNVLKLHYIGPMFRYDRPQAGRYRQFDQLGAELIGVPGVDGDAESIHLHVMLLRELGLRRFTLKVNSVGCSSCRPQYSKLIRENLRDRMDDLCEDCRTRFDRNPLRVLDCKNRNCKKAVEKLPSILGCLCDVCSRQYDELKARLTSIGLGFEEDPGLVRGLDYYMRATFEIHHDMLGAQSALGGGGRYDDLIELYGGPATPAVGFAAGLDRILLAVEEEGAEVIPPAPLDVYVASVSETAREKCFTLAASLREKLRAEVDLVGRSLQAQMKTANSLAARFSVIIGDEELESGALTVRDMQSGEQEKVTEQDLVEYIQRHVETG